MKSPVCVRDYIIHQTPSKLAKDFNFHVGNIRLYALETLYVHITNHKKELFCLNLRKISNEGVKCVLRMLECTFCFKKQN